MKNNDKTREQLLKDLEKSNAKIAELEKSETERRQVEEESRHSKELLRTVLDIVPTFICAKNLDGRFIFVNKKLTDFYGTTVDEMTGILHADICEDEKELQAMLAADREVIESGKPKFIPEETMENPDGSITVIETNKIPFTTHDQPVVLIAATNITKRKQAEEALKESEEKFRLLADNSIDAIWQMDLKLVFTYVSPSVKNIMGYTVEEWVGTRLSQHTSTKEFFNMARKALYAIKHYKEFKYLTFNVVMLHKDGTEIPVEITTKLLFNKKGGPIGLQGTTRDITNRKKAEKALEESEQRFRSYFELSLIGMAITSVEKGWIDANNKICEILGYSLDELKQKTWVELTHLDDLDADLEKFNRILENRIDSYSIEKRFFRKNGSLVFTKISVGCVRNSDGTVNYFVLLMEDITDRKIDEIVIRKSEERWQFALEGSGDGVWDWSIQLNEVFFSKQWKAMLGFKDGEISGNMEEWDKRIHPDDIGKVHEDIQKHLDGKTPVYENEHRIQCKDGTYKWIYSRGKVISSTEEGKPVRMIGTHSDITERKQANKELRKSEDRFRFMAENTGDVLYRLQYDTMTFEYLSPAISVLTGYTAEEINKISFKNLIDQTVIPEAPEVSSEELRKKRMEGTTGEWRAEYSIISKSGEEKWLGDHSFPWKDDSGKIIGSTGILQNITGRKLAELELVKHRDKLEDLIKERTDEVERSQKSLVLLMEDVNEVNQKLKSVNTILDATNTELEAFSYSVSHDLRAPLTRMDGFSKALIDSYSNKLDDQALHFLNRIRVSSQHMAKLIDDLLSLSRITREKVTRQKVDLSQTAGKIANELKASEPVRKVEFKIAKGLSANADRKFIKIFLENLLGNSFKFTGKKENVVIEFGEKIIDENEVFFIKDNGAGFNMKYYNKIFTAFQRLHSEKEYKGSGIGLAIAQRIINKHGGKIWAESEESKGTTFYFRFE